MENFSADFFVAVSSSLLIAVIGFYYRPIYYRKKLFDKLSELAVAYSRCPKQAEETYASCVTIHRYPISKNKIQNFATPIFHEIDVISCYFDSCKNRLSDDVSRSVLSLLNRAKNLNDIQANLDFVSGDAERTKNEVRQYVLDWCFVVYMLKKMSTSRNKYVPINPNVDDFNSNLQQLLGVCIDEGTLFKTCMSKLGYRFESLPKDC